ncbi:MAG: phosphate acetyltransferase [Spirochaetes bacterium]|nr:phosphate acetyltransferase [Spirochaetota bacterium]
MNFMEEMRKRAQSKPGKLVLPEGTEPRTIQAARILIDEKLAGSVTLLGTREEVEKAAKYVNVDLSGINIENPVESEMLEAFSGEYYLLRKHKGITEEEAKTKITEPLNWGAMMVRKGAADAMVGGAENTTAKFLRAALTIIKTKPGTKVASSCFVMYLPGSDWGVKGNLIFSDCATVPDPDSEQLAEIAIAAADSCRTLLHAEPQVALLSFSTKGSAKHPLVDKVAKAVKIIHRKRPDLSADGELQADAALIPGIGKKKAPGSAVAGKANVLVFPDLNSGNIGYKLVQRFAGAEAYGPFLQGFAGPVSDLSRGCSVSDIVNIAAVTLVQAQE